MKYELKKLKLLTTQICKMAFRARHTFRSAAVNWSSFQCVCAEACFDEDGNTRYRAYIEEAAPDNAEVISFISDELNAQGYQGIEISLEW